MPRAHHPTAFAIVSQTSKARTAKIVPSDTLHRRLVAATASAVSALHFQSAMIFAPMLQARATGMRRTTLAHAFAIAAKATRELDVTVAHPGTQGTQIVKSIARMPT